METKKAKRGKLRAKAATEEVISPVVAEEIAPKWKRHYQRLIDLRDQLQRRQSNLVKDAQQTIQPYSLHFGDAATDEYDRDLALSMVSSEQDALFEIEEALNRIRTGTYGICQSTGKPIESERLNAIPWTRFGREAEKELESRNAVKRTRLGQFQTLPKSDTTTQIAEDTE